MVQAIVPTATALATTYGAGIANVGMGGLFSGLLGRRVQRIDKEIAKYKECQRINKELQKISNTIKIDKESEERSEILFEADALSSESDPKASEAKPLHETANKIKEICEDHFTDALITKQIKQLNSARKIDRANQGSSLAQLVMGAGQIAVATSSIGHVAAIVSKAVIGFSFLSSLLYLGASIYGCATAMSELSENRQKQEEIKAVLEQLKTLLSNNPEFKELNSAEINMLTESLNALKTEEALLIQQRNTQAINIIAALLSLVAMALFTAGPQGTVYYAFLAASIILPLVAVGYSYFSMSEKKYIQQEVIALLKNSPVPEINLENAKEEDLLAFETLLSKLVSLEVSDPEKRKELNDFFQKLPKESVEAQRASVKKLYTYLFKLHQRLQHEDLTRRLKVEGLSREEVAPKKPIEPKEGIDLGAM